MLKKEHLPYLLTLLFGILGWTLTHIVDRIIETPYIQYTKSEKKMSDGKKEITYHFTNISSSKKFDTLSMEIYAMKLVNEKCIPNNDIDENAKVEVFDGMGLSDVASTNFNTNCHISVSNFQPKMSFKVTLKMKETNLSVITYSSKVPIIIAQTGFETFFVVNENLILVAMTVVLMILIIIYLIKVKF